MDVNRLVIEYPRGMDIHVSFIDATGTKVDTVAMAPPLLLRLGPNLEFESMSSGSLRTLLNMTESDSDDEDDDAGQEEEDDNDDGDNMEEDSNPDPDQTIDLVSSDDDENNNDVTEEEEEDDDMITVSHPIDA